MLESRKSTNQDSALIETAATDYGQILLSVVCDGMGGLAKGEVASAMLAKAFSQMVSSGISQTAV